MNKIKFILLLLLLSGLNSLAQKNSQFTQYMYNMPMINPAYSGSSEVPVIRIGGRTQWVNIIGAPRTATFSIDAPVGKSVGLGFSVIHDRIGPVRENIVSGDFSYTIFTSDEGRLAFGLKGGVRSFNIGILTTNDPDPINVPIDRLSGIIGAGVFYYTNQFYFGFSTPNFLETKYDDRDIAVSTDTNEKAPFYLTSGYVFNITENLKLKPSTMLKMTSGAPLSLDLSTNLLINNNLEFGLSYRIDDSLAAMIGIQSTQKFRIGYAFEYSTSNFGRFNSGTHELLLIYTFNRRDMKSPRFF
jgi:type IX secretion system PorP/SprF family membrane protein